MCLAFPTGAMPRSRQAHDGPNQVELSSSPETTQLSLQTNTTGTPTDAIDLSSDDDDFASLVQPSGSRHQPRAGRRADELTLISDDEDDDLGLDPVNGTGPASDDDLIIVSEGPGSRAGSGPPTSTLGAGRGEWRQPGGEPRQIGAGVAGRAS